MVVMMKVEEEKELEEAPESRLALGMLEKQMGNE